MQYKILSIKKPKQKIKIVTKKQDDYLCLWEHIVILFIQLFIYLLWNKNFQ